MSKYIISPPDHLNATIQLPASKSISNRALIIGALTGNSHLPANLSDCDDTAVIVNALKAMPHDIDIKAAGTAMRFMTAYLSAAATGEHLLTGTERMQQRPIWPLVDSLRQLDADIEYAGREGFPPLLIRGKQLVGGSIEIAGDMSSQYVSALLLIGPMLKNGLSLRLTGDIVSRPYIDLTMCTMREFGAEVNWTSVDTISVEPKPYLMRDYLIENDWSAASYWYEMLALSAQADNEVRLEGLMDGSKQGDSSARYLFSLLGVRTIFESKTPGEPTTVTLRKTGRKVPRLEFDFSGAPDLAQTFVVTCALLGVKFHFTGLQTLKIKETDRIEALKTEMAKLGFVLHDLDGSQLYWDGETCEPQPSPVIDTYKDHRMALAFAPACLKMAVAIGNPQVVTKSYPRYWDDLQAAGFTIQAS